MSIRQCSECNSPFEGVASSKSCPPCRPVRKKRLSREAKGYYWANPGRQRELRREYVARNRERVNQKKREDRQRDREAIDKRINEWREENPHLVQATERRRLEKIASVNRDAKRSGRYSQAEDAVLISWQSGSDYELARALGRTYHSIASRRWRLRKNGVIA